MSSQPAAEVGARPVVGTRRMAVSHERRQVTTVRALCVWMLGHPIELLCQWNWKAAVTSALIRGGLFFATNLQAGVRAATGAMLAEFALRTVTSGFYGAITQAFRTVEPEWVATGAGVVILPVLSHSVEFVVHLLRGTPELRTSILASMGMTVFSTAFNLHVMRRGLLVVGPDSRPLVEDLWRIVVLLGRWGLALATAPGRILGRLWRPKG